MKGISRLSELETLFEKHGVSKIYLKHLASKEDNDKNQVVLGKDLNNLPFPSKLSSRGQSKSVAKRHSSKGASIPQAELKFSWMDRNGNLHEAPSSKIIHYQQFPEIRFSGFLAGCTFRPDSLRKRNQKKYGKRILIFGVTSDDRTIGYVLTERNDPLVNNFPDVAVHPGLSLIRSFQFGVSARKAPKQMLLDELREIHLAGWHHSQTLKPGASKPISFNGNQGGGYTLEALLGIPRNAKKAPDKYGFEIKSFSQSATSLITPTADIGFEGEYSFRDWMKEYGRERKDKKGVSFCGSHRVGKPPPESTGLRLEVLGYNKVDDAFSSDSREIEAVLRDSAGNKVSGWSFEKLHNSWTKKHAAACYCPYENRGPKSDKEYSYLPKVFVCEGTSVFHFIRAIALGIVFYDPAHDIPHTTNKKIHVRPQWKINFSLRNGTERLSHLYDRVVLTEL